MAMVSMQADSLPQHRAASIDLYATAEGIYLQCGKAGRLPESNNDVVVATSLFISNEDGIKVVVNGLSQDDAAGGQGGSDEERARLLRGREPTCTILGVLGAINLLSGPYLVVITRRVLVCAVAGHQIWRIAGTDILPVLAAAASRGRAQLLTAEEQDEERQYVAMVRAFLTRDWFYYSHTLDLTRSLQAQGARHSPVPPALSFTSNRHLLAPFMHLLAPSPDAAPLSDAASSGGGGQAACSAFFDMSAMLVYTIEGFVEVQPFAVGGRNAAFGIISRRNTRRSGPRYHSRGIDRSGNVSNFVETEQLLIIDDSHFASFVQLRGSIPLFWRQNINIRYRPPFELYNRTMAADAFRRHFDGLVKEYGSVTAVNLVNERGWEGELARTFAKCAREVAPHGLAYVPFDFNKNCPRMQWDRVKILLDMISPTIREHGYLTGTFAPSPPVRGAGWAPPVGEVGSMQRGVIRMNCIDSLDRTNLVQSFVARRVLLDQLTAFGFATPNSDLMVSVRFESLFKQVWANNGDAISRHYSGTGALKGDFTRRGRRTKMGLLRDGANSMMRYYLNNFADGHRQDAMDLYHGQYTVPCAKDRALSHRQSPLTKVSMEAKYLIAPILVAISLAGLAHAMVTLSGLYWVALWATVLAAALVVIFQAGIHYVQHPRLVPPPAAVALRSKRLLQSFEERRGYLPMMQASHERSSKLHEI